MKSAFFDKRKTKAFLLIALSLQLAFDITMLFGIPVANQVTGFLYLTFVPGFIIVTLLKLDELTILEIVLFSAGFSIAFLMIAGVLINEFLFLPPLFLRPLSAIPLMIVLNTFTFAGGGFIYLKNEGVKIRSNYLMKMSPFAFLFLLLPVLSIAGAMYVNAYQNNSILLFMIVVISLLLVFGVVSKKLLPSKLYPLALFMIAIALLYHASLISNYIVPFASDVPIEYFVFKATENSAHWDPLYFGPQLSYQLNLSQEFGRINAMLAVTILPTVYSALLNMDTSWMFKLVFPLIFAFVPLGLYQIWQAYVNKKYAFIAAFLFIAQETFFTEMLGLNRQIIAELFFVLLLLVMLNEKMKPFIKNVCFTVFSFGLVTSHYALAEIFLFFISLTVILLIVLKRPSKKITVSMVFLFFAVMFAWYIFTSGAVFASFQQFGSTVIGHLGDFFNPASRGQTVLTGLGLAQSPSVWNTVSRMFAYLTQGLVVLGFISLIIASARGRIRIKNEYFILSFLAMALLAMTILIPGLANTLDMTRFYHILLFLLAPICIIGGEFIVGLLSKRERELAVSALMLVVLVPFFLFQTEFVFEVTGSDSWSIPLSGYRMNALRLYGHSGYTDAYSVYGAQWLTNGDVSQAREFLSKSAVFADDSAVRSVLSIYAVTYEGNVSGLSNATTVLTSTTTVANDGVVYLSTLDVVAGVVPSGKLSWNTSELSVFGDLNGIYANGGSEIYWGSKIYDNQT